MPQNENDLYDDAPSSGEQPKKSSSTALINRSVLGSKEVSPGDTISLRIVADHGEELEVEVCGEGKEEESEVRTDRSSESGMRSMLED